MNASELLVKCLEAEGVTHIFGIPGEENIDLLYALSNSSINFIPVRHEQGAAFMANAWGRLTGHPGVCLATLGPGATNLITGIADAYLDRSPVVAITGQLDLPKLHKESHQYVDIVSIFKPVTKWNARIERASVIPEIIRKAFRLSAVEKPGPTHIELPEDVAVENTSDTPIPPLKINYPEPEPSLIHNAVQAIKEATYPVILAGNSVLRGKASEILRQFVEKVRIPVAASFMGVGAIPADSEFFLSAYGLQLRDYVSCGFDRADLIIAVGYDPVECSAKYFNPNRDKKIIHIDFTPADVDAHYEAIELTGDIASTLRMLTEHADFQKDYVYDKKLKEIINFSFDFSSKGFPLKPLKIIREIRSSLGRDDILISDVGAHKIWIARFYPVYEPNTAIISNGYSSMGFALPSAITAKMLYPRKKILAVCGDGGFMMSAQEIETAVRLNLPIVCLILNDGGYGLIAWKQINKFGKEFGCRFGNPDFVKFAESFGAKGYRVKSEDELAPILKDALLQKAPAVIDCPVDYSENLKLTEALNKIICPV
ncbi:MAG: acetolactate synthase large subunit [Nitrospirae bacterium]|nr:acetolactate synthase large subunit [Nitrospirota bacterium]